MRTSLPVSLELKPKLEELFHEYRAKNWNDFWRKLTLLHPRCPKCNGVLIQRSNRLVCMRCGSEYEIVRVDSENSIDISMEPITMIDNSGGIDLSMFLKSSNYSRVLIDRNRNMVYIQYE